MIIQPSEYYDQDHGGRIPIFRPTLPEFEDFYAFMEAIDSYGKAAGVVKVIPPKEWSKQLPSTDKQLEHIRVRNPIIQHIVGSQGVYQQTNVEKRRPYTLNQWYLLCQEVDHKPPDLKPDRFTRSSIPIKTKKRQRQLSNTSQPPGLDQTPLYKTKRSSHPRLPPSANTRSRLKQDLLSAATVTTHLQSPPPSPEVSKRTKRELQADEIALAQSDDPVPVKFDLHEHNKDQYTSDYCRELERIYWRNLTFSQPIYGADMSGTLFDASVKSWNVNKLDNILNQISVPLPGVNTPYLYFGMWKATFPWHVEDMDLYSINYLHFGAPKQWYAIPGSHNKKFESVMKNTFFQQSKSCPEFLRHKTQIASPHFLANNGIPVHRCVQHEGEFMITFPFGYHSGYNLGFNCAESINFALHSWLDIGRKAKHCQCISDSVTIDMTIFDAIDSFNNTNDPSSTPTHAATKKRRISLNIPSSGQLIDKSCVLCDNQSPAELETSDGRMAHRLCAESIPDTYLYQSANGKWIVLGVENIPTARWKLTCLFCHGKKGACIQCCYGKCWRSFHASCAEKANATMIRKMGHNQSTVVYDVYCPLHDPELLKKRQSDKQHYIKTMTKDLYHGKEVYAKWPGSGYYKGWVEGHIIQRRSSHIKFDNGVSRIISWKDIKSNLSSF
ncbi:JmjC domain, hydroxylase-domain-containing protein [Chlamydoabsidia padenii]|nr:JmjC domain, hydroxylase-domain-containing protein [Chlamydoabsidia padenii]